MWPTGVSGPVGLWEPYVYTAGSVSSRAGMTNGLENICMISRAGTVQIHADHTRACEYPYAQSCLAVRGSVRTVCARTGYIYQAKPEYCHLTCRGHVRASKDCIGTFYRHKIVGNPCLHSIHAYGYTAPLYGSKNLRKIVCGSLYGTRWSPRVHILVI